jgi:hypothetical protein
MTPGQVKAAWWLGSAAALAIILAIFFGGPIVGILKGQVKHWQAREETATDTAVSNGAETDASQALGNAQSQIAEQVIERHTETVRYVEKASAAPDAKTPLGPDRQRRVDGHSDGLCQRRPSVCPGGTGAKGSDAGVR